MSDVETPGQCARVETPGHCDPVDTGQFELVDSELEETADETVVGGDNATSDKTKPLRGHDDEAHVYNCTSCSRSFSSRRDIVTHQYMHRENPTAFCAACNKSFSTEAAYRRHAASHTRKAVSSRRAARKTCSQCDMQFETMRQLSAHHAATHVDEKRFVCAICGSQFAWPENLRAHQRTHELDPHECDVCGRRFVDATSLRVHTRNSHGPTSQTPPQRKQHCCKLCNRSFQFDFSLRAHMKGHAQSPVAASLRRSKQLMGVGSNTPRTQTKYVHVDSKGVIDLGMDVAESAVNQPSEIIVEVYNYDSDKLNNDTTDQSLDFSDVLDQSSDGRSLTKLDAADHTDDQRQEQAPNNPTSQLVWYVKPDTAPADGQQAVQQDSQQQQQQLDSDEDDNEAVEKMESAELSRPASDNEHVDIHVQSDTAADDCDNDAHDARDGADGRDGHAVSDNSGQRLINAAHETAVCCHDDDCQHQQPQQADVTDELADLPAPVAARPVLAQIPGGPALAAAPAVGGPLKAVAQSDTNNADDDNDNDGDDDGIDWMDAEPPRRRAAPFIFRQASRGRRRSRRPREPYLFNCVMTDEKPFICMTCGQCFRWEISLNIHQRLHTDGTFPNKSRAARRPCQQLTTSRRRGKSKQTSSPGKSSVVRSCIVRHRRTSSDEEDDEFTFHVQADGPAEVSTHYPQLRRQGPPTQRGRGRQADGPAEVPTHYPQLRRQGPPTQRGRGRGRGQCPSDLATAVIIGGSAVSVSAAAARLSVDVKPSRAGCNGVGVGSVRQSATTTGVKCDSRPTPVALRLRAGYICRQCERVVTTLAALKRHQRRAHVTTRVTCLMCSAKFTSRFDLRRHCHQQHDTVGVGVTRCRRCQRVFTDSRRHSRLHRAAVKPAVYHKQIHSRHLCL